MGAVKGTPWGNVSVLCGHLLRLGDLGPLLVRAENCATFTPLGTE